MRGHIPSSDISKISYNLRYTTYSYTNGFYNSTYITNNYNAKVILLGFSRYTFVRTIRICYFYIYFANIRRIVYSKKIIIILMIKYKNAQEYEAKEVECKLINNNFDNQNKYNCSFYTNDDEIEKITINKTADFDGQNVEILSNSSIAEKHMDNIVNIKENDIFEKKLLIFDNCSTSIDNEQKEFNITGSIDNNEFNYTNINLTINLENSTETQNVSCNVIKLDEQNYTLQCKSKEEIDGDINGAIALLDDENLVVNLPNDTNSSFTFPSNNHPGITIEDDEEEEFRTYKFHYKKGPALTAGAIVGIVLGCIAVLVISVGIILYLKRRPSKVYSNENTNSTVEKISIPK